MKRLDKDIYSQKAFNDVFLDLMDRYRCSIKVYKDFKISELGDHFETISWFQDDTPYNLMWHLLTCVIGQEPQSNKKYLIEKMILGSNSLEILKLVLSGDWVYFLL